MTSPNSVTWHSNFLIAFWKMLCAAAVIATWLTPSSASAEWLKAETAHFTIRADTDRAQIVKFARELEMLDAALFELAGAWVNTRPLGKVDLYIVDSVETFKRLTNPPNWVAASFSSHIGRTVAVAGFNSSDPQYSFRESIAHEYAHYFSARSMPAIQPQWFKEGFASLVETAAFPDQTSVVFGELSESTRWILNEPTWIRMEDLLDNELSGIKEEYYGHFYAQGWLLAHYTVINGKRKTELDTHLARIAALKPATTAQPDFAGGAQALYAELRTYAEAGKFAKKQVTVAEVPDSAISVSAMSPAEIAMVEPSIQATALRGFDDADALLATLKALHEKFPEDRPIAIALAEVSLDLDERAFARKLTDTLLAGNPKPEPELIALDGQLIMMQALKEAPPAQFERLLLKARNRTNEALRLAPNNPSILLGMYEIYEADTDAVPEAGFGYLKKAITLDPDNQDLRWTMAHQYAIIGNMSAAADALRPIVYLPHRSIRTERAKTCMRLYEDHAKAGTKSGVCVFVSSKGS